MNVIDNLHPISPVGGSLPAGGSAHAGHAYFASLITPFVTGDFNGVPPPSDYANKMKQPIVEAPSVTWKSAGPGKKRLKLTKKPDGSYVLAPEDDSFDGFLDYGGDNNIPPPPPPPPGAQPPAGDITPNPRLVSNRGSNTDVSVVPEAVVDYASVARLFTSIPSRLATIPETDVVQERLAVESVEQVPLAHTTPANKPGPSRQPGLTHASTPSSSGETPDVYSTPQSGALNNEWVADQMFDHFLNSSESPYVKQTQIIKNIEARLREEESPISARSKALTRELKKYSELRAEMTNDVNDEIQKVLMESNTIPAAVPDTTFLEKATGFLRSDKKITSKATEFFRKTRDEMKKAGTAKTQEILEGEISPPAAKDVKGKKPARKAVWK